MTFKAIIIIVVIISIIEILNIHSFANDLSENNYEVVTLAQGEHGGGGRHRGVIDLGDTDLLLIINEIASYLIIILPSILGIIAIKKAIRFLMGMIKGT